MCYLAVVEICLTALAALLLSYAVIKGHRASLCPSVGLVVTEVTPNTTTKLRGGGTDAGREEDMDMDTDAGEFSASTQRKEDGLDEVLGRDEKHHARKIPEWILHEVLPEGDTAVADIIRLYPFGDKTPHLEASFSSAPPTTLTDPSAPVDLVLPHIYSSVSCAQKLRVLFDYEWTNGAKSITLPSNPTLSFPLWVEPLLQELELSYAKQIAWVEAVAWLSQAAETCSACPALAAECEETWDVIPWDCVVPGLGRAVHLTTKDLAYFLSDRWLTDEMINAGADYLMRELGLDNHVYLANSLLLLSLESMRHRGEYSPRTRSSLDEAITSREVDELHIPVNVNNNHWTLLTVDMGSYTYSYSDSLAPSAKAPPHVITTLGWWLTALRPDFMGQTLKSVTAEYTMPVQSDSFSCGVVVLATLAAHLIHTEPWSQTTYAVHRMAWYLRLCQYMQDSPDHSADDVIEDPSNDFRAELVETVTLPPLRLELAEVDMSTFVDNEDSTSPTTANLARKRPRSPGPSTGPPPHVAAEPAVARKKKKRGPKSCSRALPQIDINPTSWNQFERTIRTGEDWSDPNADFQVTNPPSVRCSSCMVWTKMRRLYDCTNFKKHRLNNKCRINKVKNGRNKSLSSYFSRVQPRAATPITLIQVPCPGLIAESNWKVLRYLNRTSTAGGGAPSRSHIAKTLYGVEDMCWRTLSSARRKTVLAREVTLYKWRNHRTLSTVFASHCLQQVEVTSYAVEPLACENCRSLYSLPTFQVQLNREMPAEEHMKYVPKLWRDEKLGVLYAKHKGLRKLLEGDGNKSPWTRFAKGVADGLYATNSVMLGMIQALVHKTERVHKGKSLKNMTYPRIFTDFTNCMASLAPAAYNTFQQNFGGPALRSLRQMRARSPRFEPGFSAANVSAAKAVLQALDYHGPLALSYDDTSMDEALTVWQSSKDSTCKILGSANGVIDVMSEADFEHVFELARRKQADKLRLYVISIPFNKVPPIVVAAIARGSEGDAELLSNMYFKILELLHTNNMYPVSVSADGTDVERSAQRIIESRAESYVESQITNPVAGCTLTIRIYLVKGGHPFITLQDVNHGRKTGRNQLFTGARILAMGTSPCFYAQVHALAMHPDTPLFRRDVENADKQDDRAAAREFAVATLDHSLEHFPSFHALHVYLYAIGAMVDAWQSRSIVLIERAQMVMQARYFLMAWRQHVDTHPDYSVHIQFISRESYDIFLTICDGLLGLILIYRRYFPSYPLLPWLHSTEPCEHIFGVLRQLKADFNYMDSLYLQPKLRILLLAAFNNVLAKQKPNETAAGYFHSYFLDRDTDLEALSNWPTDEQLRMASVRGYEGASQLLSTVGIDAAAMLRSYRPPELGPKAKKRKARTADTPRPPQTLLEAMALCTPASGLQLSMKQEDEVEACQTALIADSIERTITIESLPDSTNAELPSIKAALESQTDDRTDRSKSKLDSRTKMKAASSDVANTSYDVTKPLQLVDPHTKQLCADVLIQIRTRQEPRFVTEAVRKARPGQPGASSSAGKESPAEKRPPTLREQIYQRLQDIKQESQLNTAGANRQIRHTGSYTSSTTSGIREVHKRTLKTVAASKFASQRTKAFADLQVLHENMHNAGISEIAPLDVGAFVLAWWPISGKPQLVLGRVLTMYEYSGGKHGWMPTSATALGEFSYVDVEAFRRLVNGIYSSIACDTLQCPTFLRIPPTHVILSFASYSNSIGSQKIDNNTGMELVTLCSGSLKTVTLLEAHTDRIAGAVQCLGGLIKGKAPIVSSDPRDEHDSSDSDDADETL